MASTLPVPGKRFVIGVPYVWLLVFYNVLLLTETWLLLPRPAAGK